MLLIIKNFKLSKKYGFVNNVFIILEVFNDNYIKKKIIKRILLFPLCKNS